MQSAACNENFNCKIKNLTLQFFSFLNSIFPFRIVLRLDKAGTSYHNSKMDGWSLQLVLEEKWQQCIPDAIKWIQRVFTEAMKILLSKTMILSLLEKLNCSDAFSRFVRTSNARWYDCDRLPQNDSPKTTWPLGRNIDLLEKLCTTSLYFNRFHKVAGKSRKFTWGSLPQLHQRADVVLSLNLVDLKWPF